MMLYYDRDLYDRQIAHNAKRSYVYVLVFVYVLSVMDGPIGGRDDRPNFCLPSEVPNDRFSLGPAPIPRTPERSLPRLDRISRLVIVVTKLDRDDLALM